MSTPSVSAPAPTPEVAPPAPAEPGYFESAARAVWVYVQSIFEAIAKCFGCQKAPVEKPEKAILARLAANQYSGPSLLFLFEKYFKEEERGVVYRFEGQQLKLREPKQESKGWLSGWKATPQQTLQDQIEDTVRRGGCAVFDNPAILVPYLSDRLNNLLIEKN